MCHSPYCSVECFRVCIVVSVAFCLVVVCVGVDIWIDFYDDTDNDNVDRFFFGILTWIGDLFWICPFRILEFLSVVSNERFIVCLFVFGDGIGTNREMRKESFTGMYGPVLDANSSGAYAWIDGVGRESGTYERYVVSIGT